MDYDGGSLKLLTKLCSLGIGQTLHGYRNSYNSLSLGRPFTLQLHNCGVKGLASETFTNDMCMCK